MAKKPNISPEEIHQACWQLIEQKQYPNIPRLADYFLRLDGRKCSNTTLLKAMNEWHEMFEEQQKADIQDLSDILKSPFEQFMRNSAKQLNQLLAEKQHSLDEAHKMKRESIDSKHLSLMQQVVKVEEENARLKEAFTEQRNGIEQLENKLMYSEQRLKEVMEYNQTLKHQIEEKQQHYEYLRLNNAQQELNLAKQDHHIVMLTNQLKEKSEQLNSIQKQLQQRDHQIQQAQKMQQQLNQLQLDMTQLVKSHGDNKQ